MRAVRTTAASIEAFAVVDDPRTAWITRVPSRRGMSLTSSSYFLGCVAPSGRRVARSSRIRSMRATTSDSART